MKPGFFDYFLACATGWFMGLVVLSLLILATGCSQTDHSYSYSTPQTETPTTGVVTPNTPAPACTVPASLLTERELIKDKLDESEEKIKEIESQIVEIQAYLDKKDHKKCLKEYRHLLRLLRADRALEYGFYNSFMSYFLSLESEINSYGCN